MTVCSYFLRGTCKYGDRCRNEHPGSTTGSFGNQTWASSNNRLAVPYTLETIISDVTPYKDKPLWPLSSYGPAKYEPILISGLDESPEELRLMAVTALKAGTTADYTKYEMEKIIAANQMFTSVRDNVRQVYEQALRTSARIQASGSSYPTSTPSSAFGVSSAPSALGGTVASAFGKPAFGQPAFGQTGFGGATSGTSAFGQTTQGESAFGTSTRPASAFSQPSQATSAFGQTTQTTSAFGQPSQPASVFGQPSALGAATQPASAFGKPSQSTSVFGQPSQPTSAFGQPSQPASVFGQPSQPTSAFAQPTQPTQPTSAFSQSSQVGSTFGQTSQPAFGQSSLIRPATGAFGGTGGGGFSAFASQPSTFTSAAAPGPTTGTTPGQSAFGATPQVQSAFTTAPSALGIVQPSPMPFGNTLSVPAVSMLSPPSSMGGSGAFASPMTITPSTEKPTSSTPDFSSAKLTARMRPGSDRYLDLLPRDYNEIIPPNIKAAFASAKFEWGKIPEWIPPAEVR